MFGRLSFLPPLSPPTNRAKNSIAKLRILNLVVEAARARTTPAHHTTGFQSRVVAGIQIMLLTIDRLAVGIGHHDRIINDAAPAFSDFAGEVAAWSEPTAVRQRYPPGQGVGDASAQERTRARGPATRLHPASEEEAEARLSERRKQPEEVAAAQGEREKALRDAEEALKQAADAQRRRARIRNIALVVVSIFAVLAVASGLVGWIAEKQREQETRFAEQQRATAEEQRTLAEQQKKTAKEQRHKRRHTGTRGKHHF